MLTEKICTRCRELLPVAHFSRKMGNPHGLDYECKTCHAARERRKDESVALDVVRRVTFPHRWTPPAGR